MNPNRKKNKMNAPSQRKFLEMARMLVPFMGHEREALASSDTAFSKVSPEAQDIIVNAVMGKYASGPPAMSDEVREELKQWAMQGEGAYEPPKKEELTCFTCRDNSTCPYAWDDYNTDGDCLAEK